MTHNDTQPDDRPTPLEAGSIAPGSIPAPLRTEFLSDIDPQTTQPQSTRDPAAPGPGTARPVNTGFVPGIKMPNGKPTVTGLYGPDGHLEDVEIEWPAEDLIFGVSAALLEAADETMIRREGDRVYFCGQMLPIIDFNVAADMYLLLHPGNPGSIFDQRIDNLARKMAQVFYAAYTVAADGRTYDGKLMPTWDGLGESIQGRYFAGLRAVFSAINIQFTEDDHVPPTA